jgi:Tfp pilus assembly protein PilX
MRIQRKSSSQKGRGYVLLITLSFLIIVLIALASMMTWLGSNTTTTQRNNQFIASEYAAEAASEKILGQMEEDFLKQSLTNTSVYAALIPTNTSDWPIQYQFSASVSEGTNSGNIVELPSPYIGLSAFTTPCTITCSATPIGQRYDVPATNTQTFLAASIPIFQYVIFYNLNLEIDPGASMPIEGNVFSNYGIWSGTGNVTYSKNVWAVGNINTSGTDPFAYSKTDSGTPDGNFTYGYTSGKNHLTMPVAGTNDNPAACEAILQWPPSNPLNYSLGTSGAYSTNGQVYLANASDLIISNAFFGTNWGGTPKGTNFMVYYQDPSIAGNSNPKNFSSTIVWVTNDFYIITNANAKTTFITNYISPQLSATFGSKTNIYYAGYSFLTNVYFYDWREGWNSGNGKAVQTVQFDVANFNAWLGNTNLDGSTNRNGGKYFNTLCDSTSHKDHPIDGIYIYNNVPFSTTELPAVRVINGSIASYDSHGLSIATPFPLYVKDDFNTTDGSGHSDAGQDTVVHTRPAAFYADSITILSTNWSDVNSKTTKMQSDNPPTTTINAACLEGIVPSDSSIHNSSSYSGGVENFLRLLEDWSGHTLYYHGSIVVMFPSEYATNRQQTTGNYYNAPTRRWGFDTNFEQQVDLPPMTPQLKTVIRDGWNSN